MTLPFIILGGLTLAGAVAAVSLRNLVHCALSLAAAFVGLAGIYLLLDAQFVGFAQVLVYVGAVAILIVFAILLTRGGGQVPGRMFSGGWLAGAGIALAVFAVLCRVVLTSKLLSAGASPSPEATVRHIGDRLMTQYVLPLEVIGLLLTAALIGAVITALHERRSG